MIDSKLSSLAHKYGRFWTGAHQHSELIVQIEND